MTDSRCFQRMDSRVVGLWTDASLEDIWLYNAVCVDDLSGRSSYFVTVAIEFLLRYIIKLVFLSLRVFRA